MVTSPVANKYTVVKGLVLAQPQATQRNLALLQKALSLILSWCLPV